jgi:hypothetical protein
MAILLALLFVIAAPLLALAFVVLFLDSATVKDLSHGLTRAFQIPSRSAPKATTSLKSRAYEIRMNYPSAPARPPSARDFAVPYSPPSASEFRRLVRTEPPPRAPAPRSDCAVADDRWAHRRPGPRERPAAIGRPDTAIGIADTTAEFWKGRSAASRAVLLAEATNPLIAPAIVPAKAKAAKAAADALPPPSKSYENKGTSLLPPPPNPAATGSSFSIPMLPNPPKTGTTTGTPQFSLFPKK